MSESSFSWPWNEAARCGQLPAACSARPARSAGSWPVTPGSDRPNIVAGVDGGWPVATVLCRLRSGRSCWPRHLGYRRAWRHGLWEQVVRLLRRRHSPEQISGILRRMHPGEPQRNASHETLYTALYAMPQGELRSELISCLRQARRRRLPRARGEDRRGKITHMVSIHMRPPEIKERIIPGHWEGDLIKGIRGKSVVGTLVERSTLFVTLAKIRDATADAAVAGFSHVLKRIDAQRRLSLTYDQGREMAAHQRLTKITGVKVYFADPHSPWQRGINENTNGLLRQYLPKDADLSVLKQSELDAIAWQLNTRPRKSLGWKCPAELFIPNSFNYAAYYKAIVALPT